MFLQYIPIIFLFQQLLNKKTAQRDIYSTNNWKILSKFLLTIYHLRYNVNMREFIRVQVSALQYRYPEGTHVRLFGVANVPDGTLGVVDFVDDMGFVFIETPEGLKNVVLNLMYENTHFFKE